MIDVWVQIIHSSAFVLWQSLNYNLLFLSHNCASGDVYHRTLKWAEGMETAHRRGWRWIHCRDIHRWDQVRRRLDSTRKIWLGGLGFIILALDMSYGDDLSPVALWKLRLLTSHFLKVFASRFFIGYLLRDLVLMGVEAGSKNLRSC